MARAFFGHARHHLIDDLLDALVVLVEHFDDGLVRNRLNALFALEPEAGDAGGAGREAGEGGEAVGAMMRVTPSSFMAKMLAR